MPTLQILKANTAPRRYNRALSSALNRQRIWDPDWSSINEPQAWTMMQRDADVFRAMDRMKGDSAGLVWRFVPKSTEIQDIRVAEIMESLFGEICDFYEARKRLVNSRFRGAAYEAIAGSRRNIRVLGDAKSRDFWVPTSLTNVDKWRFELRRENPGSVEKIDTQWYMYSVARKEYEPLLHTDWFIRHSSGNTEDKLGYGGGMMDPMFFFFRGKAIAQKDGLSGLKRWSMGWVHAKVDDDRIGAFGRDNDTIVDDYIAELKKQVAEHILVTSKNDEINVIDGAGTGWEIVKFWVEYFKKSLDALIDGTEMPSANREGGLVIGGNASETASTEREGQVQQERLKLSETITKTLGRLVWNANILQIKAILENEGLPTNARMPAFMIGEDIRIDPNEAVNQIGGLLGAGVPLLKEQIEERTGWTVASDEDIAEGRAIKMQQPQPGFDVAGSESFFSARGKNGNGRLVAPDRA